MKTAIVQSAAQKLNTAKTNTPILVGFDGFIDEVIRVVDTRQNADHYETLPTIETFGKRIAQYAGLSGNIELVPTMTKLGGNGPIMANAMLTQGANVSYVGALGHTAIHPIFQDFANDCKEVITLADPAHTDALEFNDGKIMFGKLNSLLHVNWTRLNDVMGTDKLNTLIQNVAFIACTNWTMLPSMNTIIEGLTTALKNNPERKTIFIDLADPAKRSDDDIHEVLQLFRNMQNIADVVFGLNENESERIATLIPNATSDDLSDRAKRIRNELNLHMVVIHPTRGAAVADTNGTAYLAGPYTEKPKLTTGAGDNFNAGFCTGLLAGLTPEESLATGVCSSGFYVRNCRSATRQELVTFMNSWANLDCGDLA